MRLPGLLFLVVVEDGFHCHNSLEITLSSWACLFTSCKPFNNIIFHSSYPLWLLISRFLLMTCFRHSPSSASTSPSSFPCFSVSASTPSLPSYVLIQQSLCNILPSIVLCLSHSTTLRSCYRCFNGPCLTALFGRLQYL